MGKTGVEHLHLGIGWCGVKPPQNVSEAVRRLNPHLYGGPQKAGLAPVAHSDGVGDTHRPPKRIRQSQKPLLNKLEQEWYEVLKRRHLIVAAQSLRFMLGNGIWYKPDFIAWPSGFESQDIRMRAFEVKGPYSFRGGFENLKVAAHKYPQVKWSLVWKENGQWKEQTVWP